VLLGAFILLLGGRRSFDCPSSLLRQWSPNYRMQRSARSQSSFFALDSVARAR